MSIIQFGTPLRVYLAAPYRWKDEIQHRAAELRAAGITVTSQWLNEPHTADTKPTDLPFETNRFYAEQDFMDVVSADVLVLFADHTKSIIRAGRHVEVGIAIGVGLQRPFPIFVVGREYENIFHYLPQVHHFDDWNQTLERLLQLSRIEREQ